MKPTMKKVYTISKKAEKPRVWLQSLVCEAAGWNEGDSLYVRVSEEDQEIIIQNKPLESFCSTIHVSGRKSPTSQKRRPLVDTAGSKYASILSVKQKVEICVYKDTGLGKVVIRPLHYKLLQKKTLNQSKMNEFACYLFVQEPGLVHRVW